MQSLRKILEKQWTEYDKDNKFFTIFDDDDLETALDYYNDIRVQNDEKEIEIEDIDKLTTFENTEENLLNGVYLTEIIADSIRLKEKE